MRTETQVHGTAGGLMTAERSHTVRRWHPFSFNPHGRAIEAAVKSELLVIGIEA